MPTIRYLKVSFSERILYKEIPFFRSAVIEKTKRVSSLFHNHKSDTEVLYRYPLIQYKIIDNKAGIICLNAGTQDIHHLLSVEDLDFQIGKNQQNFSVEEVVFSKYEVCTTDTFQHYKLKNWVALNQDVYPKFLKLQNDVKKQHELLESVLRGNILSFAKGIEWWIDKRIEVRIKVISKEKKMPLYKNNKSVSAFDVEFETNLNLPEWIGLGKRTSVGYGVLTAIK